jgi:hypothetical protein
MLQRAKETLGLLLAGAAIVALGGCAATRSTFDVPPKGDDAVVTTGPRTYVALVRVTDRRIFEANPRKPSVPSLEKPEDLANPAIKARAIARKRGGFGNAMADILLPEGRTVEQVVREAVARALRDKGYGVVEPAAPERPNALPLEVDIQQFWMWMTPGFWTISLEYEGIVTLKGPGIVGTEPEFVRGYAKVSTIAATDEEWRKTATLGVNDLTEQLKARLRSP